MLLDSNIIIYSAKREHGELRRFMVKNAYSVSAVSLIEVPGYHLLGDKQRQYLIEFFQAANILRILFQPSSDGFPEGLLDQPFYGWGRVASVQPARFNGLRWPPLAC